MKNYSYIGISFVILLFGIWSVPKIIDYFQKPDFFISGQVPEFSFTNQYNKTITNDDFKDKVYVIEFFFTTCPSICPIMNQNMQLLEKEFYGNLNFGIASFTINPEYDTPEVLKNYAESYGVTHPNWHFLTGDKEAVYKLSNEGFLLYTAEEAAAPGGFEHSGLFALIDQQGNIRSRKDPSGNPKIYYNGLDKAEIQMLKEDIKKLLK